MAKKSRKYLDPAVEDFIKEHPDAVFMVSAQTSGSSGFHAESMDADSIMELADKMPISNGWGAYAIVSNMFYDEEDYVAYDTMAWTKWLAWRDKKYKKVK